MSGQNDASAPSCANNPDFAVICSFFEQFNEKFGLLFPSFQDLHLMIENTEEVPYGLIELHVKLLRKLKKSTSFDRWEKAVVKFAHTYSHQDAWELERFGYKKSNTEVKLRLLKNLLEAQFDGNPKFRNELNKASSSELRLQPLGRDLKGRRYWHLLDDDCNLRVYREDMDEETWEVVANDRESMVKLIETLTRKQNPENEDTSRDTSEESNTNSREGFLKNEPCEPSDPVVGEAIESPVLVIRGEGSGADCETGNPGNESEEPVAMSAIDQSNDSDRSIESGQGNNGELAIEERNLKEQNLAPTNQDEGTTLVDQSTNSIGPCDPGGTTEIGNHSSSDPHENEKTILPAPNTPSSAEHGQQDSVEPSRDSKAGTAPQEASEQMQVDKIDSIAVDQTPKSETDRQTEKFPDAEGPQDSKNSGKELDNPDLSTDSSPAAPEQSSEKCEQNDTVGLTGELPLAGENQPATEENQVSGESAPIADASPDFAIVDESGPNSNPLGLPETKADSLVSTPAVLLETEEKKDDIMESDDPEHAKQRSVGQETVLGIPDSSTEVCNEQNPKVVEEKLPGLDASERLHGETLPQEGQPSQSQEPQPEVDRTRSHPEAGSKLQLSGEGERSVQTEEMLSRQIVESQVQSANEDSSSEAEVDPTSTEETQPEEKLSRQVVESQLQSAKDEGCAEIQEIATGAEETQHEEKSSRQSAESQLQSANDGDSAKAEVNPGSTEETQPEEKSSRQIVVSQLQSAQDEVRAETKEVESGTEEIQREGKSSRQFVEFQAQSASEEGTAGAEMVPVGADETQPEEKSSRQEVLESQRQSANGESSREAKAVVSVTEETQPEDVNSRHSALAPEENVSSKDNLSDMEVPERVVSMETEESTLPAEEPNPQIEQSTDPKEDPETKPEIKESEPLEAQTEALPLAEEKAHPDAEVPARILRDDERGTLGESEDRPTEPTGMEILDHPEAGPASDKGTQQMEELDNSGTKRSEESSIGEPFEASSVPENLAVAGETSPDVPAAMAVEPRMNKDSSVTENPSPRAEAKSVTEESGELAVESPSRLAEPGPVLGEHPCNAQNRFGEESNAPKDDSAVSLSDYAAQKGNTSEAFAESHPEVMPVDEDQRHVAEKPAGEDSAEDKVNVDSVSADNLMASIVETQPGAGLEIQEEDCYVEKSSRDPHSPKSEGTDGQNSENSTAAASGRIPEARTAPEENAQDIENVKSTVNLKEEEDPSKRVVVPGHDSVNTAEDIPMEAGRVLGQDTHDGGNRSGEKSEMPQKATEDQNPVQTMDLQVSPEETHPEGGPIFDKELRSGEKSSGAGSEISGKAAEDRSVVQTTDSKIAPQEIHLEESDKEHPICEKRSGEGFGTPQQAEEDHHFVQTKEEQLSSKKTHPEVGPVFDREHPFCDKRSAEGFEIPLQAKEDQIPVQFKDLQPSSEKTHPEGGPILDKEHPSCEKESGTGFEIPQKAAEDQNPVQTKEEQLSSEKNHPEGGPILDKEYSSCEKQSGAGSGTPQKAMEDRHLVQTKDLQLPSKDIYPEGGPGVEKELLSSEKSSGEGLTGSSEQETIRVKQEEAPIVPVHAENSKPPAEETRQVANASDSVENSKPSGKLTDLTFDFDDSAPLPQLPAILQKTPGTGESGTTSKRGRGRPRARRRNPDLLVAMQYQEDSGKKTEITPLRQSSRIAKLREKEDEERRKLEAERLQRFKEEVERRERRRLQREERKKRHEEKLQRRQEKVSGKKKIAADESEDSDDSSSVEEKPRKGRKEKKKKKKKMTPWDSSETSEESSESDDGLDDLHQQEEEEEEEDLVFKSDHEFSPESDLDADGEVAVPTRHARTAKPESAKKQRKAKLKETVKEAEAAEEDEVDEEEEEEKVDDANCQKCGQSDHPEWILLCDGCDNGWHASCLRPALLVVPEGDWFCPPCEHATLIDSLQERLEAYDYLLKEKEAEVLRQQTAAAAKAAEAQQAVPFEEEEEEDQDDAASGAEEKLAASGAEEESEDSDEESDSESASDEEESASDDAVPGRRQRRAALQANYSFKEYDAMIKSALRDENDDENHVGEKDGDEKKADKTDDGEGNRISRGKRRISSGSSDEGDRPRTIRRKRIKRLNDLSATSSDNNDSDESFKGASEASDSEEEEDSSAVSTSSFVVDDDSDSDVINVRDGRRGRNSSPPSVRRSTRNPRKRIMVSDTSSSEEESSEEEPKRKRSNRNESWDESEESSSDASWGRRKKKAAAARPKPKKPVVRPPVSRPTRPPRGGAAARGRGRGARTHKNESDDEPFRTNVSVKKLKQQKAETAEEKEDHEDSDQKRRSTRGRQVSYKEMISSGESQEEDEETSKKIAEFLSARIPGRSAGTGTRGRGRGRGNSSGGIPFVQSAKPKLPLSGTASAPPKTQTPAPESESESRQSVADDFSSAAAAASAAAAVYSTEDSQTSNEVQNLVIATPSLDGAELLPTVLPQVADVVPPVPLVAEIPSVVETAVEPRVEIVPVALPNLPPDLNVSRLIQQAPGSPKPRKDSPPVVVVVETPGQLPAAPEPVIPPYSGVIKQVRHSLPPTLAMYPTAPSAKTEHNLPATHSVIRPYPTSAAAAAASPAASNSPTPGNPLSIQGLLSGTPAASTPSVLQQLPSSAASTPLRPYATTPHIISHAPYLPQPTYASPYNAIGGRNSFGPPPPAASRSPYPNLYPYPGYPSSLRHPGTFQHAGYPQAFAAAAAAAASAEEERRIYRVAQAGREGESPYDAVSSAAAAAKTAPPLDQVPGNSSTAAAGGGAAATQQESEFGGLVSYFSSQQEDFGES